MKLSIPVLMLGLVGNSLCAQDLGPAPVFDEVSLENVLLGRDLFYDPILSGNRNISCGTCHHPKLGTADAVSLAFGEGGIGLGPERTITEENRPEQRLPRNAPGLWNLGAREFVVFFHDGRLEQDDDQPHGLRTPLDAAMTGGFKSALAAQAMFPVLSPDEMAGHYGENDISSAVRRGLISQEGGAWDLIAARVEEIPAYKGAFDEIAPGAPITFAAIANVIADFIAFEWRADNSLFDKAMRGEASLPETAARGLELFYGKAQCSTCHSGWFQTDHDFHAIAMPQIGPGKSARFETHARDDGRLRVTGAAQDAFAFRTPSLRNVTHTAPYGHSGAYARLEDVVRHHLDPVGALKSYRIEMAALPQWAETDDTRILRDNNAIAAIAAANVLRPVELSDAEVDDLIAFLHTLEDPVSRLGVPETVPSGLSVDQ